MNAQEQFRNIDIARWPQEVRIEWGREDIRDDTADRPDEMDDGFWPSHDSEAAGYVEADKFDEQQRKAVERMERWENDEWYYIGVRAKATIYVPIGGTSFTTYSFSSPGLWGIESDSGDYLDEVFEDQKKELEAHLEAIGDHFNRITMAEDTKAEKMEKWRHAVADGATALGFEQWAEGIN